MSEAKLQSLASSLRRLAVPYAVSVDGLRSALRKLSE